MSTPRIQELVRNFPQNGYKILLTEPGNLQDLLRMTGTPLVSGMGFDRLRVEKTTYVAEDFRHLESDVVVTVPFRPAQAGGRGRRLLLYILIEHQTEPDELMLFRVLYYMVLIWQDQLRKWKQDHGNLRGVRLQPILPVVFYTGTRTWERLQPLSELVEEGSLFAAFLPLFQPLFVNLPALSTQELAQKGGYFGVILEAVQKRHRQQVEFTQALRKVLQQMAQMPDQERPRRLELLSFLHALVYHERVESEHQPLQEMIVQSVAAADRKEVADMGRTIAEALREEGRKEGHQEGRKEGIEETLHNMLLTLLRERFHKLPCGMEAVIKSTQDQEQLNTWLKRFATAQTLQDVGIPLKK